KAVNDYHFGVKGRPRFKQFGQLDSLEGKNNTSGLRWDEGTVSQGRINIPTGEKCVSWLGLRLDPLIYPKDKVIQHGLAAPVKFVRLVRRKLNGRNRFYVQLVCEGIPYHKEDKHPRGKGIVGLDIGPSTIAIVSQIVALLLVFCAQLQRRD